MDELAAALQRRGLERCDRRELYRYRQFFLVYPQIVESLAPLFNSSKSLPQWQPVEIVESLTPQLPKVSKPDLRLLDAGALTWSKSVTADVKIYTNETHTWVGYQAPAESPGGSLLMVHRGGGGWVMGNG